jgi:hypothetical protein
MLSLGDYYEHIAGLSQKERGGVLLEYAKLMQNSKFAEAVSKATSDEVRVHARIRLARSLSKRLFG